MGSCRLQQLVRERQDAQTTERDEIEVICPRLPSTENSISMEE